MHAGTSQTRLANFIAARLTETGQGIVDLLMLTVST